MQALEYLDKSEQPSSDSDTTDTDTDNDQMHSNSAFLLAPSSSSASPRAPVTHPKFEITTRRKFEISELCQIFVHRYLKYAFLLLLSIQNFLTAWSFSTVAGSAWAVNIPFRNFGAIEKCEQDAFLHNALPSGGCLYAYYFCLFLFALIVVTLSMIDLKEQAFVQLVLGLMRFITVGIIIVYCIVRLAEGGDACRDELHVANDSTEINVPISFSVVRFEPRGWVLAIPIFTYAFLFHTCISALTHPIKQKAYLHWLLLAMFLAALFCYMCLGVVVPLWFRASIQETCTLNWVREREGWGGGGREGRGRGEGLRDGERAVLVSQPLQVDSCVVWVIIHSIYVLPNEETIMNTHTHTHTHSATLPAICLPAHANPTSNPPAFEDSCSP